MGSILVNEEMSGADETLLGFECCDHMGLVVLRKNNENTLYYKEYISERTRNQAIEVARQLVSTRPDLEDDEVIVAFYMFEGTSNAKDVKNI